MFVDQPDVGVRDASAGETLTVPGRGLVPKLVGLTKNASMRGIASVFVLKCAIIVSNFALVILAARTLSFDEFGLFSILYSAAGLFCIVATVGQQITIMRQWNEHVAAGDAATLKGALYFSALLAVLGCAGVALGFYIWSSVTHTAVIAIAVTLYLVTFSVLQITNHLVRTAVNVEAGDGVGNLFVVCPALVYLGWALLTGARVEISTIFFIFTAGSVAALAVHGTLIWRKLQALFPDFWSTSPRYDVPAWRASSIKLWISNGMEAANQYIDVLIVGYLMSPAAAGAYFVTVRLANAFATAADTVHMFATRHIPELYYQKKTRELNDLLNIVAAVTVVIVAGGLLVMLPGGKLLLSIFNTTYTEYSGALALQCLGTAAVAAAGPSGTILMLTGHEGRFLTIITATVVARVALFWLLIPHFGIMGAVTATVVSFVLMAVLFRSAAKAFTGLDGSIFRLLNYRRRSQPEIGPATPLSPQ